MAENSYLTTPNPVLEDFSIARRELGGGGELSSSIIRRAYVNSMKFYVMISFYTIKTMLQTVKQLV